MSASRVWHVHDRPGPLRPGHLPLALLALGCMLGAMSSEPASASPPDQGAKALDLARVCAGEAGLQTETSDCGAIHHVLTDRARRMGVGYRTAARWYASRHFDRGRSDRRRWVAWLHADGRRPEGWPEHLSWSAHREQWMDLQLLARQYVTGDLEPPCTPHLWGDRYGDRERAERHGWEPVICGRAHNLFWRVPWAPPVVPTGA